MKTRHQLISVWVAVGLILAIMVPTVLAGPAGPEHIRALYQGQFAFMLMEGLVQFGPRVAGGPAEKAAAERIARIMKRCGLDVEIQEFDIVYFEEVSPPALEQVSPNPTVYVEYDDFLTMSYSGSGDVTASVEPVDLVMPPAAAPNTSNSGCEAADFAGFTPGNIALIQRGTCYYSEKALNAENAGAVGAIIFNEGQPGRTDVIFGTLGGPGVNIPVVGTTFALGEELYNLTLAGDVTVHMFADTISEERTSQNVIGTLEGTDPEGGIVYMGGHYDSVSAGPGANDDASGVGATLEAAKVLGWLANNGHRTKATLKFIAFGSEETGLDGSYNYVVANEEEVATKGIGMINLDMVGVGDTLLIGNIDWGGPDLTDYTREKANAWGLNWAPFTAGENSDHTYFEMVGVPAVFLHQSPDPFYHTPEDTPDKVNGALLDQNGELATETMYDWANGLRLESVTLRAMEAAHVGVEKVHVYHDRVYVEE